MTLYSWILNWFLDGVSESGAWKQRPAGYASDDSKLANDKCSDQRSRPATATNRRRGRALNNVFVGCSRPAGEWTMVLPAGGARCRTSQTSLRQSAALARYRMHASRRRLAAIATPAYPRTCPRKHTQACSLTVPEETPTKEKRNINGEERKKVGSRSIGGV